jgi:alpha-D-ribose 1-methylphosphonate 5-triphosphate synthase subunit PhnL
MNHPAIQVAGLGKTFVFHLRGSARLQVLSGVSLDVRSGECVVLGGPSGIGKSSILRMIYGNYRVDAGSILIQSGGETVDIVQAEPRQILALRRRSMSYVSQFLRVIPRVSTLDIVAEPLVADGVSREAALERAGALLARLNLPERLWSLPPATFSGGEQARVNIARGFASSRQILLLDEPTASLDAANRDVVAELVFEKKQAGAAVLGIFHDEEIRTRLADRIVDVTRFAGAPAAAA